MVHPIFKLTLDDTILSNKLLDLDLNPWFKLKLQLWFINISIFLSFFPILPCSITERFTVLICLVYKHLFFSSSFFFFFFFLFDQFFFFFFFYYLKYTLGKGKLCLQRFKKVRLLQYLGVSDVNTIKRKKQ